MKNPCIVFGMIIDVHTAAAAVDQDVFQKPSIIFNGLFGGRIGKAILVGGRRQTFSFVSVFHEDHLSMKFMREFPD